MDYLKTAFNYIRIVPGLYWNRFKNPYGDSCIKHPERSSLAVLLHGLNGYPCDMFDHRDAFDAAGCATFCPEILKRGNCPLRDAVAKILPIVRQHIEKHPNASIALIGMSNGGRIASMIEAKLREYPNPVFVSTIGTPHQGTYLLDIFGGVLNLLGIYSIEPIEDMKYNSARSKVLIENMKTKPLPEKPIKYLFVCGTNDCVVWPTLSATPDIGYETLLVRYHGHISTLYSVAHVQTDQFLQWRSSLKGYSEDTL